jgi:hypothetical protein
MDRNKQIQITRRWLEKYTYRLRGKNTNNFICQINNQYLFTLCLWIGENNEVNEVSHQVRDNHWWRQCFPWNSGIKTKLARTNGLQSGTWVISYEYNR